MKLDHTIKVLFVIMLVMLVLTSAFTYYSYNSLCNNQTTYTAVELLRSDKAYTVCGANFGIVNTGAEQINVTKLQSTESEANSELIEENAEEVETIKLSSGQSLAVDASDQVYYKISSPLGSNLEQTIQVRKF